MLKNKKIIPWLIGIVVLIVAIAIPLSQAAGTSKDTSNSTASVTTITLAESIDASGYLEAQSFANLAWKTAGTVEKIHIGVGKKFKAGDILLSLQTTSANANIISAQSDLVNAEKDLDDVLHSNLALAKAEQDLANAKQAVEDAKEDIAKIDWRRADDDLIDQTEDEITLAKRQVSRLEDVYKRYKKRPAGDPDKAQAELNLINARNHRDELIATLNWYRGKPSEIDAEKYRAALAIAQAQQADAQREVDRLIGGPNSDDVAAARARVDAAQANVNSLYIIAPFDGEVLAIEQNPGDEVSSGTVAVFAANRSNLHVDAQVDEADISRVEIGNKVTVTMDAAPDKTFTGAVTFINPVGQSVSGLIKYSVRVQLDPLEAPLLLGASADVNIQVSEPRVSLAVPAIGIQSDKSGEYVIVIKDDGSFQRVDVISGESVGDLVVISGNLAKGDKVQSDYGNAETVSLPGMN